MNALQSYSSDEESANEAPTHKVRRSGDPGTNYDDVGMDISEDSGEELAAVHQGKDKLSARSTSSTAKHQESSTIRSRSSEGHPVTSSETNRNNSEARESHRSSLQERLLGLASGGSQQMLGDDRSSGRDRRDRLAQHRATSTVNYKSMITSQRSRSRSREREGGRSTRDHSSRSHHTNQGHSGRGRDSRKSRDDQKRKNDDRRSRRSRSRSRSRDRRRSRSRSRDRRWDRSRSRSRSRERHRRSRSRERKRPMDIRKEAQQKLAALKAANPDLTAAELLKRSMDAQVVEVQKQTGITLPSYYNPAAMNPMKFAEQERKKKLLWGNKNKTTPTPLLSTPILPPPGIGPTISGNALAGGYRFSSQLPQRPPVLGIAHTATSNISSTSSSGNCASGGQAALWANTRFSNDRDGKMAEKFRRLMGVKNPGDATVPLVKESSGGGSGNASNSNNSSSSNSCSSSGGGGGGKDKGIDILQKQETMFSSMERQYEMARIATHTHKGFGLGFTSQSFIPK